MIIPFVKKKAVEPKCSFCQQPKSQCKSLVGSTISGATICDKCLETCHERLLEYPSVHSQV